MDEKEVLQEYFRALGEAERIVDIFRGRTENGQYVYTDEQLTDMTSVLGQQIPYLMLGEEKIKIVNNSQELNNMSFDALDQAISNATAKSK